MADRTSSHLSHRTEDSTLKEDDSLDHFTERLLMPPTSGVAPDDPIDPIDPIAAVTHSDPYPYYRALADRGPIHFDPRLDLWVVTSHAAIREVLRSSHVRTRPVGEPVPGWVSGTATGGVFAQLVRMTDDPGSRTVKRALHEALATVPPAHASRIADALARRIFDTGAASRDPDWPTEALFALPVSVMGCLLGVPDQALAGLTGHGRRFAASIAPPPFTGSVDAGDRATAELVALFSTLLDETGSASSGLLADVVHRAGLAGQPIRATIVANLIGLLFQSLDATAGLIANTLVALAAQPDLLAEVAASPEWLARVIDETARHDCPVQNTRRFVASPMTVAGQPIEPGATLLLLLAAANRDPTVFTDPDQFDPERDVSQALTFGLGPHGCPGRQLAVTIARVGISAGIRARLANQRQPITPRFVPSPNVRIPMLTTPGHDATSTAHPFRSII